MGQAATSRECDWSCCSNGDQPAATGKPISVFEQISIPEADLPDSLYSPFEGGGEGSYVGSVRDLTQKDVSQHLLRGISLRETLRQAGQLWRYEPSKLTLQSREKLYAYSRPVEKLDIFLSHTWVTAGEWKFLSLLLHSGWRSMLIAWLFGITITFALCLLDFLPMSLRMPTSLGTPGADVAAGCWIIPVGFVCSTVGLFASPYIPQRRSDNCFVDFACIHQADENLQRQGINSIGSFLATSSELRVLWSAPYLSRLWCIFELGAYHKLNPTGKITLAPLFIELVTLQLFLWQYGVAAAWWIFRATMTSIQLSALWFWALMMTLLGCCGFALVHKLRHSYLAKKRLISGLVGFDVKDVACSNESDQESIHAAIVSWYGSLDAFSEYVRGEFRKDVLEPMRTPGSIPFGYICVLAIPSATASLEVVLAIAHANMPPLVVVSYILSYVVGLGFFFLPAIQVLCVFLCEQGAESKTTWRFHLQTLGILTLIWTLSVFGAVGAYTADFQNFPLVLSWTGVSLLFAGVVWRFCFLRLR